jgi:hypothetical protein
MASKRKNDRQGGAPPVIFLGGVRGAEFQDRVHRAFVAERQIEDASDDARGLRRQLAGAKSESW